MRVSREVMAQRHDEIISQTSKLLRDRGIGGTSLADLMGAVGLTHGGFYKHFESKDALVAEATEWIFAEINGRFAERSQSLGPKMALKAYVSEYLMASHVKNPEIGCPIPSFGPDVRREGSDIRRVFTDGMKTTLALMEEGLSCPPQDRRQRALELMSLLSGAVLIARASGDKALANEVISSTQQRATKLIEAKR